MVKIMPRISQAVVEWVIKSPPISINISFTKVLEWLFLIVSAIKLLKDRKLSSGLVLLLSVSLVGKGFFKRKTPNVSPVETPVRVPSPAYEKSLSDLAPAFKHYDKAVYEGEGDVIKDSKSLKISPSDKKAYFEELAAAFQNIDSEKAKAVLEEIRTEIAKIQPSDTAIVDAEAFLSPEKWIFSMPTT